LGLKFGALINLEKSVVFQQNRGHREVHISPPEAKMLADRDSTFGDASAALN
jgi:hypothetical protein